MLIRFEELYRSSGSEVTVVRFPIARYGMSTIYRCHCGSRVARPRRCASGDSFVDSGQIAGRKLDLHRAHIFFQVVPSLCSRYGDDLVTLGQDPRQRELSRRAVLLAGNLLDAVDQLQIPGKVLTLKARVVPTHIIRR